MKTYFALGSLLLVVSPIFAQEKPFFPDVPPNHWAFSAIQRLAKEGILQGYPEGIKFEEIRRPSASVAKAKPVPLSIERALRLTPLIKNELYATAGLHGATMNVDTNIQTRQVTLQGIALSQYQKALAGVIARKFAKDYTVVNSLQIRRK